MTYSKYIENKKMPLSMSVSNIPRVFGLPENKEKINDCDVSR